MLPYHTQPSPWIVSARIFVHFKIFLPISSLCAETPWFQALVNIIQMMLVADPNPYLLALLYTLGGLPTFRTGLFPTTHPGARAASTTYKTMSGHSSASLSNQNLGHCIFHLNWIHLILVYRLIFWEFASPKPGLQKLVQCAIQAKFWIISGKGHLPVVSSWR